MSDTEMGRDLPTEICALDLETKGLMKHGTPPEILCFSYNNAFDKGVSTNFDYIQDLLNEYIPVFHNAAFDVSVLKAYGYRFPNGYHDTMLMSYCYDPSTKKHSLDHWGNVLKFKKFDKPWKGEYPEEYSPELDAYALRDAELTYKLYWTLREKLEANSLWELYTNLDLPYSWAIIEMQECGLFIRQTEVETFKAEMENKITDLDKKILEELGDEYKYIPDKQPKVYKKEHPELEDDFLYCENGEWYYRTYSSFNPASNYHKGYVLINKYGWVPEEYGDNGDPSVSEAILRELPYPIAEYFTEIAKVNKILSSFVTPFLKFQDDDGFVHGQFNQTVTITGRLSSSNPNLQNLPKKGEMGQRMRSLVTVPQNDWKIVNGDLSNIEARVLAYYLTVVCDDGSMAQPFIDGTDFHSTNAAKWGLDRDMAKKVLYLLLYGGTARKLATDAKVSIKRAEAIFNQVYDSMPSLIQLKEKTWNYGREHGYVMTILGRKLYYKGLRAKHKGVRGRAERQAFNALLQGSAADIMKMLTIKTLPTVYEFGAKPAAAVHDEALYYCEADKAEELSKRLTDEWSDWSMGIVPVTADFEVGTRWSETH